MMNKHGRIVSKAKHGSAKREMRLVKYGYTAESRKIGWAAPIFIADTDQKALEIAKPHIEAMFNKFLNLSFEMLFPPGYLSLETARRMVAHKRDQLKGEDVTAEHLIKEGIAIIGSPDTVRRKLEEAHRLIGFQNFLALLQFGTLSREDTERNIRRFCTEVAPTLQGLTDREYEGWSPAAANALA